MQELPKLDIKEYNVVIKELPVVYETILEAVPRLWKEYNPKVITV